MLGRGGRARRPTLALLAVAVALGLAVVSAFLGWQQYRDGQRAAIADLRARVLLATTVLDTYFTGQLAALAGMAESSAVRNGDEAAVRAYLERVERRRPQTFTAGLAWIGRDGALLTTSPGGRGTFQATHAGRSYVQQVVATGKQYVSEGLVMGAARRRALVLAVPTRDRSGRLTGVLAGGLRLVPYRETRRTVVLGYEGLALIDRTGRLVSTERLERPANGRLLAVMRRQGTGVHDDSSGLDGGDGRVVAFAASRVPGWLAVLDRPRAEVFAAARHSLLLALGGTGAATLIALGLIGWAALRSGREAARERAWVRRWSELTGVLGSASDAAAVSRALAASLAEAFPAAVAIVAYRPSTDAGISSTATAGAESALDTGRADDVDRLAQLAFHSEQPLVLTTRSEVAAALDGLWNGSVRAVISLPLVSQSGLHVGGIALAFSRDRRLSERERAMLAAHGAHAADALARARVQELEHDVAASLQRSLLPAELPDVEGLEVVAHYRAGGTGLEVGGDWYDVVRRADGIVHLSVGDVAGRGINAAALMGQLRHAGRAYAHEHDSPADVIRGLLRHVPEDGMATLVCVTIDPYTLELRYASAGHPPALHADATGTIARLDGAAAPPLGFTGPEDCSQARLELQPGATLVMYTDGLVERRSASIDAGIDTIAGLLPGSHLPVRHLADEIVRASGAAIAPNDDVALLVARLVAVPSRFRVELPGRLEALTTLRRRLDRWLALRGLPDVDRQRTVLIVHEAVANAAEHAYPLRAGSIVVDLLHARGSLRISVRDAGTWRPPPAETERGYGLALIRAFADVVRVEHADRGTVVTAIRRIEPAALEQVD